MRAQWNFSEIKNWVFAFRLVSEVFGEKHLDPDELDIASLDEVLEELMPLERQIIALQLEATDNIADQAPASAWLGRMPLEEQIVLVLPLAGIQSRPTTYSSQLRGTSAFPPRHRSTT